MKEEHTVVVVATDDMAITSKRLQDVEKLKDELCQHWKISDLGELTWYLENYSNKSTILHQGDVRKFTLTSAKPVSTPMDPGTNFLNKQCPLTLMQLVKMCGVPYAEVIGSVLWLVMILRPDCVFAVSTLAQFIQNHVQAHWEAVKRVMVYLGTVCVCYGSPLVANKPLNQLRKGTAMWTGWDNLIGTQYPGIRSILVRAWLHGARRSNILLHYQVLSQNTSH